VIFPVTTLRCAMRGVGEALDVLRDPAQTAERMVDGGRMLTRAELYETLAYLPGERWSFPGSNNNNVSSRRSSTGTGTGGGGGGGGGSKPELRE
jgi:uncharacterized membrane protein YgcG